MSVLIWVAALFEVLTDHVEIRQSGLCRISPFWSVNLSTLPLQHKVAGV